MYRSELSRVYELHDLIQNPRPPGAYFRDFDSSLAEYPQKRKQFGDIERDLQGLDSAAWAYLKAEAVSRLMARDVKRGWQALFDILNQAKAYNYLKGLGCTNIAFIPVSRAKGRQTPDLEAELNSVKVLCEVKTINISEEEAARRQSGGVGTSTDRLEFGSELPDGFLAYAGRHGCRLHAKQCFLLADCSRAPDFRHRGTRLSGH